MKKSRILLLSAFASLTFFAQLTQASNLRWLDYSPARHFTDQDWEIATAAAREALNDKEDGVAVSWENPASKNHGTLTPLNTQQADNTTCRDLRIENHAGGLSGNVIYQFCQQPDGKWKVNQESNKADI
jgi:surface antigen